MKTFLPAFLLLAFTIHGNIQAEWKGRDTVMLAAGSGQIGLLTLIIYQALKKKPVEKPTKPDNTPESSQSEPSQKDEASLLQKTLETSALRYRDRHE